jgi:hypothetical protein
MPADCSRVSMQPHAHQICHTHQLNHCPIPSGEALQHLHNIYRSLMSRVKREREREPERLNRSKCVGSVIAVQNDAAVQMEENAIRI